ncbi:ATP-binding cassette domain-containing protein [Candidatus Nesciobacter abundans]|uniref:ATP-binding cassette domain-containing protein n=1 Tax=Candidatus Nesciobacter abundans TaxID=2601668 RepID=A0A5C0UH21_9PROT|nr:ATP-binding cassette domain-containing protein [Candidatus Nesciobacter abundans]QEK39020.1 ATP-binding cassette domain-containing protein [Candidatus Nesciobacter abundans]
MQVLSIKDLTTRFGDKCVHDNLSFGIRKGQIFSLMGSSGSGKSTLLNLILGIKKIQLGEVFWFGEKSDPEKIRKMIGFQPQSGNLIRDYNVIENVALPIRINADLEWDICYELAAMKIKMVGLDECDFFKYPHMLSGGMTKRAALARAIALDPDLVILDEPLSGLDFESAKKFQSLIWDLVPEFTIMCVTHDYIKSHEYAVLENKKIRLLEENDLKENFIK